jgi:hypothetical protein
MICLLSIWIYACCAYLEVQLGSSLTYCCSFIDVLPANFRIFTTFLPSALFISDFNVTAL